MNKLAAVTLVPSLLAALVVLPSCDVPLQEVYPLQSQTSLPEGVAYDTVTHTFFATAINGGKITRITPLGQEIVFHSDANPNMSFGGAHVDEDHRRLWVCAVDVKTNPFPTSQVWAFNIETKKRTHVIPLPPVSFCNDLVTDATGHVYVTDSANPNIYLVNPKTQSFSVFLTSPTFNPVQPGMPALNGIDLSPDGDRLLAVTTFPAGVYSIPVADPQSFVAVQTSGDPFAMPGDPRFPGPDGAEFHDGRLYVAYDGGVQALSFADPDFTQATVATTTAVPTGLTSLTVAEDQLYAIDS
ncbi:MAG TPA: SMP-30/gluconolactonase/LRE family protein, partial [Nannocystis sp.]